MCRNTHGGFFPIKPTIPVPQIKSYKVIHFGKFRRRKMPTKEKEDDEFPS